MDEVLQFKIVGDVRLTVPLAQGFDKILFDFVQMAATKSGFREEESDKIASKISQKAFSASRLMSGHGNHQQVEIFMSHRPGQIAVQINFPDSSFSEEELFEA